MWYFITEVLIAILLLAGFLFLTYGAEPIPELETLYLKSRIWDGLKALDDLEILRAYAVANQTLEIKEKLSELLPGIPLEVSICYESPCMIPLPYEEVVSISYFLAGDYGNFKPTAVIASSWFE